VTKKCLIAPQGQARKEYCHFDQREKSFSDPSHSLGMTDLGPSPLRLAALRKIDGGFQAD
jgi:hypothetical protein